MTRPGILRFASFLCCATTSGASLLMAQQASSSQSPNEFVHTIPVVRQRITDKLESIDSVSPNLWTFNALRSYEPEWKTEVFYVTNFVIGGKPPRTGQLIELDYKHNRARSWPIPIGIGSWSIIEGQDHNLYMGSYNGGQILCFDPRTKKWLDVPQAPPVFQKQEFIITDLVQAPNGDIYYGTYPGAHLVKYDIHNHTVTDLGKVADEKYVRWLTATPDGVILCGVGPAHARMIAFDPRTNAFRTITPPQYQTPGVFPKPLANASFIVEAQHRPGGKVLVYNPKTFALERTFDVPLKNNGSGNQTIFTMVDDRHLLYQDDYDALMQLDLRSGQRDVLVKDAGTAANNRWYFDSVGNMLGLLVQSYVYIDRKAGTITHHIIPIPGSGQNILWLNSTPEGAIYGGPPFGQTMFRFDPQRNALTEYDQVIDRTGEIYYGIPFEGKIYTMSYAEAGLAVLDAEKPWSPGERPASNPRTLLYLPEEQYRPIAGVHAGPNGKLYIGTQPDYGLLGGALSEYTPSTGALLVHRNIIPDQEISAIGTDDRFVYCLSDPNGGLGSTPSQSHAHFFVWDPQHQKIVYDHEFAASKKIDAIAVSNGHAYFVESNQLMDFDQARQTLDPVLTLDPSRTVPSESLVATKDGSIVGIFGKQVGRFSPHHKNIEYFEDTAGYATIGLTIGSDGTIYFGGYTSMYLYHPTNPSPLAFYGR